MRAASIPLAAALAAGLAAGPGVHAAHVLLVVEDDRSPHSDDSVRQTAFESWGHTVTLLDDSDPQSAYEAAIAGVDVVYISENASAESVGNKLRGVAVGVVSEHDQLDDALGFSNSNGAPGGDTSIQITDASHAITGGFSTGRLAIYSRSEPIASVSGPVASGAETLATLGGEAVLAVIEAGGTLANTLDGVPTAGGRRVRLPTQSDAGFDFRNLNSNGLTLVENAIAWAADGRDAPPTADLGLTVLMVTAGNGTQTRQEALRSDQFRAWGCTVTTIYASASQDQYDAAAATADVAWISEQVDTATAGARLAGAAIGVVCGEPSLAGELGVASSDWAAAAGSSCLIKDNYHSITSHMTIGDTAITAAEERLAYAVGALAPGAQVLASFSGGTCLAAIGAGDELAGSGGAAAGRRVQLPWGGPGFDWANLNNAGLTIALRALEWAAAGSANRLLCLSLDGDSSVGGVATQAEDLFAIDPQGGPTQVYFDGTALEPDMDIDAAHVLEGGGLIFSIAGDRTVGGVALTAGDLARYDAATGEVSVYLAGASIFGARQDIDACCLLDDGGVLLSTADNGRAGSLTFNDEDVLRYDPAAGTLEMYLDVSATLRLGADLTGVHRRDDGKLLIAFRSSGTANGVDFHPDDVLLFSHASGRVSIYQDGAGLFSANPSVTAISQHDASPGNGLVAHWRLDETTGTLAEDSSGNGNDAIYTGSPRLGVSAVRRTGVTLATGSQFVRAPASASLDAIGVDDGDFTLAYWVKPGARDGSWRMLLQKGDAPDAFEHGMWLYPTTNEVLYLQTSTHPWDSVGTSSRPLPDGHWSHLTLVKQGSTMSLYVDAALDVSTTLLGQTDGGSGSTWMGGSDYYDGASGVHLDDVRIYSRALTHSEIAALHGLVGRWKLDEDPGDTAADSSGASRHGTVVGDPQTGVDGPRTGDLATRFDGADDGVLLPAFGDDFSDGVTLSGWVKPLATVANQTFLQLAEGGSSPIALTRHQATTGLVGRVGDAQTLVAANALIDNLWQHVTLTADGDGGVRLFRNGVLVAEGRASPVPPVDRTTNWIGRGDSPTDAPFHGDLYDMRVYNRAISSDEAEALYFGKLVSGLRIIKWIEKR